MYEAIWKKVNGELNLLEKGELKKPDLFDVLKRLGFGITERAEAIRDIAEKNGYMVYDCSPDIFKQYNPKVVFVTDQHGHFDDAIASMFNEFTTKGLLRMEHVVSIEGENGRLKPELSKMNEDGSLSYVVDDGAQKRQYRTSSWLAKVFPAFRDWRINVKFCDDMEAAKEFVEAYVDFNLAKLDGRKVGVDSYYAPLFKRSDKFLQNLKRLTGHDAVRWQTFQVYGIVDHIIGHVQKGLQEKQVSYMGLVPKKISSDDGFEYMKKLVKNLRC